MSKLPLPKTSWFLEYVDLWPTVESPDTYIGLSMMSMFGACLGRRCWFDQDFVKIYPMLNLLLIGPSGLGKSTCIDLATEFVQSLMPPDRQPRIMGPNTKEGIHKELGSNARCILTASELANFFNKAKYNEALIPYITELLDYKKYIECNTKGGGISQVQEPSVTICGGSTLQWLSDELPDTAASGGFLPRFFIIVEEQKRALIPLPGMVLSPKERDAYELRRERAKVTFSQLVSQAPVGSVKLRDYGVAELFSDWYRNQRPAIGHLEPFVARSREVVLRLSLIIALSCGHSVICMEDMESAISLYQLATLKLAKVAAPISGEGKLLAEILKALGSVPKSEQDLYRSLDHIAPAQRLEVLLQSHLRTGAVIRMDDGKLRRVK